MQVFVPYANASATNETAKYLDSHLVHTGQFFSTDAMHTYVRPFCPALPTAFLQICLYAVCVPNITQTYCLPVNSVLMLYVCLPLPPHTGFCKCVRHSPCPVMLASLLCKVHEALLQAAELSHKNSRPPSHCWLGLAMSCVHHMIAQCTSSVMLGSDRPCPACIYSFLDLKPGLSTVI